MFTAAPKALNTNVIVMSAERPSVESTGIQFLFAETSGKPGGKTSGWIE